MIQPAEPVEQTPVTEERRRLTIFVTFKFQESSMRTFLLALGVDAAAVASERLTEVLSPR